MAVMTLSKTRNVMEAFIKILEQDFPSITFLPGDSPCWKPRRKEIFYAMLDDVERAKWSVLHEMGHALLGHDTYKSEIELLRKETQAWQKAEELARSYGILISQDHIQTCIDSYRDWLHTHSSCPKCHTHGLQLCDNDYICSNCQQTWRPNAERFRRAYRLKTN